MGRNKYQGWEERKKKKQMDLVGKFYLLTDQFEFHFIIIIPSSF